MARLSFMTEMVQTDVDDYDDDANWSSTGAKPTVWNGADRGPVQVCLSGRPAPY